MSNGTMIHDIAVLNPSMACEAPVGAGSRRGEGVRGSGSGSCTGSVSGAGDCPVSDDWPPAAQEVYSSPSRGDLGYYDEVSNFILL